MTFHRLILYGLSKRSRLILNPDTKYQRAWIIQIVHSEKWTDLYCKTQGKNSNRPNKNKSVNICSSRLKGLPKKTKPNNFR